MAAGAGGEQHEPDRYPSLRWAVVPAGAGVDQQPDTSCTTTGNRKKGVAEYKGSGKRVSKVHTQSVHTTFGLTGSYWQANIITPVKLK